MHERVKAESDAVRAILRRCKTGEWTLAASAIIEMELNNCPDPRKRASVYALYSLAEVNLPVTEEVEKLSVMFQNKGIGLMDRLHLALAEIYHQDVVLTTDDAFLARAGRVGTKIRVANPVSWFREMTRL